MLEFVDVSFAKVALALFFGGVILIKYLYPRKNEKDLYKNLPPSGPREWPVIGCMLSLIGDEPHKIFADMGRKYGPVFHTYIGSTRTVVLNDFESIREAFARSGDDFADRPKTGIMEIVAKGKGLVCAHVGESHHERRRFSLSALRSLGMGKSRIIGHISTEINNLVKVFIQHRGEPFVPFQDITVSMSNVISWIVFGKRFGHDDVNFRGLLENLRNSSDLCVSTGVVGFIPILARLPLPVWQKLEANSRECRAFSRNMIKEALERSDSQEMCFVRMYYEEMRRREQEDAVQTLPGTQQTRDNKCMEESEKNIFNEDDVIDIVGDLFGAGTDTTATTLHWAILYLVLYPDIQCKIHAELDKAIGRKRNPTLDDQKAIPYTKAVLLEVQRAATVVPFGAPHSATTDAKLFNFDIPADTLIMSNIWAVHHDPKIWWGPEKFRPERFLNEDGTAVLQRDELIPFSIGRRKCLGEELAKMELFLFFAHLVHRFEFRLPDGAPPPSMAGTVGATRNPKPFKVCVIPRDPE